MSNTISTEEREELLADLRERIPVGTTIYTVLRGEPARSGGYRRLSAFYIHPYRREPVSLDYSLLCLGIGSRPRGGAEGVGVSGGGMDMGFHVVHSLGRKLWPNGFESENMLGEGTRHESDGGYALIHRWL